MKVFIVLLLFILCIQTLPGRGDNRNLALCLDGHDNNIRTGMDTIRTNWTLEAWIKGDNDAWQDMEVLIGGGEYSDINIADNFPLVLKKGRLHSNGVNLTAPDSLDSNWHHVAASCSEDGTSLYIDGQKVAQTSATTYILPGTIGVADIKHTFGGLIDEVRIWRASLPAETIRQWMNRPLEAKHPFYPQLKGYYTFDDMQTETALNWVGHGHQAYHLRNGRNDYKGTLPLAYAVPNDNPSFINPYRRQHLFNAVEIQSEWDADQGTEGNQVLKLRIAVQGSGKPLRLNELCLDLSGTDCLSDIQRVHVYYSGQTARSSIRKEIFGSARKPEKMMLYKMDKQGWQLSPGINYFLVTFDLNPEAKSGNILDAKVSYFKLNRKTHFPETDQTCEKKRVTVNSKLHPETFKVLQWNIWHGGIHLGNDGPDRIIELIRKSRADIITMQEAYGSQEKIAQTLNFHLQTASKQANLALYSRFPLRHLPASEPFKSNPAIITLPNKQEILVNGCWLYYAYRPEYTAGYMNTGMNPEIWVKEDSILALRDIRNLITKDIKPYLKSDDLPVIIGGDFNSCSHLDWTEAAKHLHMDYGPVNFPVSRYMYENGYKDSFREINPDEVSYQGGSVAVIYGQLQMSRIDFIYYKGAIQALSSKIVRTMPEIDDVWPSDHGAVITVFKLKDHSF